MSRRIEDGPLINGIGAGYIRKKANPEERKPEGLNNKLKNYQVTEFKPTPPTTNIGKSGLNNRRNVVNTNGPSSFAPSPRKPGKPNIVFLVDVYNWAWDNKAKVLKKYLSNDFNIDIIGMIEDCDKLNHNSYDLYFTFGYSYIDMINDIPKNKKITGITAHRPRELIIDQMNKAEWVHANSIMLYKELKQIHQHVYYLPNGVDEKLFHPKKKIKLKHDKLVAGHVGKLCPAKGQLEVIEPAIAMADVHYHKHYNNFTTALPLSQMVDFYQDIDVFICASDEDGTPNPALESAACGRPIISNFIGNMPEFIINNYNGFLIPKDINKYVEKLQYLRDHRSILIEMGKAARKTILEDWTWKRQAERYRLMLKEIFRM